MRSRLPLLALVAVLCMAAAAPPKLRVYDGKYYVIHTDIDDEKLREADLRMTRMVEVYRDRTRDFAGTVGHKFPFYLYSKDQDYYADGGVQGSAGFFDETNECLKAMAGDNLGDFTWHVIQHEGFHQFAHAVIGGDLPIWVNEGLAEYFGEGVFTGDGMITGVIPQERLQRVQQQIRANAFKSVKEMMLLPHSEWNKDINVGNYDQAWSMVHFLAHGENGKYQKAFAGFVRSMSTGHQWQEAWQANFGTAVGFEDAWKKYWLSLPDRPTADLYAKAAVETITGTLGRASAQRKRYATFDAFSAAVRNGEFKPDPRDWVPPSLLSEAFEGAEKARANGVTFELVPASGPRPMSIVCTLKSGTKLTGRFVLKDGRVAQVVVDQTKR